MQRSNVIVNHYENPAGFDIRADDIIGRIVGVRWQPERGSRIETSEGGIYPIAGRMPTWVTRFEGDGLTNEGAKALARKAQSLFDTIAQEEGPLVHLVWKSPADHPTVDVLRLFASIGYTPAFKDEQPFLPLTNENRLYRVSPYDPE